MAEPVIYTVRKSRAELAEIFPDSSEPTIHQAHEAPGFVPYPATYGEVEKLPMDNLPILTKGQQEAYEISKSGLLAHFPDGETREPTKEELAEMGKAMVERMFGNPVVQELIEKAAAEANAPPPPKISGNHCRLCKSFLGDDPRGALWSTGGLCATYAHVQTPVEPEHYCQRFVFNEALRDAEPK